MKRYYALNKYCSCGDLEQTLRIWAIYGRWPFKRKYVSYVLAYPRKEYRKLVWFTGHYFNDDKKVCKNNVGYKLERISESELFVKLM